MYRKNKYNVPPGKDSLAQEGQGFFLGLQKEPDIILVLFAFFSIFVII